jgi:hypothetical protein
MRIDLTFVYHDTIADNKEQGICQSVIFMRADTSRPFRELIYSKAVLNN